MPIETITPARRLLPDARRIRGLADWLVESGRPAMAEAAWQAARDLDGRESRSQDAGMEPLAASGWPLR
jgi:hypothetical protein